MGPARPGAALVGAAGHVGRSRRWRCAADYRRRLPSVAPHPGGRRGARLRARHLAGALPVRLVRDWFEPLEDMRARRLSGPAKGCCAAADPQNACFTYSPQLTGLVGLRTDAGRTFAPRSKPALAFAEPHRQPHHAPVGFDRPTACWCGALRGRIRTPDGCSEAVTGPRRNPMAHAECPPSHLGGLAAALLRRRRRAAGTPRGDAAAAAPSAGFYPARAVQLLRGLALAGQVAQRAGRATARTLLAELDDLPPGWPRAGRGRAGQLRAPGAPGSTPSARGPPASPGRRTAFDAALREAALRQRPWHAR